jgi:predicted outer membrane protein
MLIRTLVLLAIAAAPMMAPAADTMTLSARDEAFIHQLANSCKSEIRTAEVAMKRHLTDAELDLARQLIDVHTTAMQVLATIARTKHVATRDEVQADQQERIVNTGDVAEKDFNLYFLHGEIINVSAEIALCEVELNDGSDDDLKLFVRTYLPGMKKCLTIAKEFAAKY